MKRLWLIPVALCVVLVPVAAVLASSEDAFDSVVSSVEREYHVHATRIPLMGLVSLISNSATRGGVRGMHVAEIEGFTQPIDGEELNTMVAEKLGPGWSRMIRETNRSGKEQTLIFVHPEGSRMGMFIVDKDGNEMDIVQLSVDPDHLNESIGKYERPHPGPENDTDTSN
jgi:hypothetical protein